MAGHSKWANIKHRKGAQDAKRGKLFTKLIKEISIAARVSGSDSNSNPRLRMAIQNAKGANVPKDNIERAIKKATGADGTDYTEVTYEGYAPHGIAVYVECSTDNLKRTVADVRSYFNKTGGNLSTNGSLEFLFERKGVFLLNDLGDLDAETFELEMIDAGAEEIEHDDDYTTVLCLMEDFGSVQKKIDDFNIEVENAELRRIPHNQIKLEDQQFLNVMKLIDLLEDNDDVQKVYHNLEITEEQENLL